MKKKVDIVEVVGTREANVCDFCNKEIESYYKYHNSLSELKLLATKIFGKQNNDDFDPKDICNDCKRIQCDHIVGENNYWKNKGIYLHNHVDKYDDNYLSVRCDICLLKLEEDKVEKLTKKYCKEIWNIKKEQEQKIKDLKESYAEKLGKLFKKDKLEIDESSYW